MGVPRTLLGLSFAAKLLAAPPTWTNDPLGIQIALEILARWQGNGQQAHLLIDIQIAAHGERHAGGRRQSAAQRDDHAHGRGSLAGSALSAFRRKADRRSSCDRRNHPHHARLGRIDGLETDAKSRGGAGTCRYRRVGATPAGQLQFQPAPLRTQLGPFGRDAVGPRHGGDVARNIVDREIALAKAGQCGIDRDGRYALRRDPSAIEHGHRPFEPGLGGLEGLGRAVVVGRGALFKDQVAPGVGGHQGHDEEQQAAPRSARRRRAVPGPWA